MRGKGKAREGKQSFFEKKDQKTFAMFAAIGVLTWRSAYRPGCVSGVKSLLLLFFRKEGLALPSPNRAASRIMSSPARLALLALCAAAPFPQPQPGLSALQQGSTLSLQTHQEQDGAEEITVFGNRAPMQRDPHATTPTFRDVPESLQAYDLWAIHYGSPPCCQSPYETDIGGQPGLP